MKMWATAAGVLACWVSSVGSAETWVSHQKFVTGMTACQAFQPLGLF